MNSFVVVGLGYGDEGKGATVDFLCSEFEIDYVIKYSGGHQAGHRVVVGDREHVFSQFGSGAFAGVPTILDRDFIVEPKALEKERDALESLGASTTIYIHPECPVTTRYHRAFNRITELHNGHGSCGVGVGATRMTDNAGVGLRVEDFGCYKTESKIRRLRSFLISELSRLGLNFNQMGVQEYLEEFDVSPRKVCDELSLLDHASFVSPHELQGDVNIVFEGSQGVLLDELYGQHPNTTWSTVTPRNALEFPGFDRNRSLIIGVMRTFLTRHGNGYVGAFRGYGQPYTNDPNNQHNAWQGTMRSEGWDTVSLNYAASKAKPDCLAINHLDEQDLFLDIKLPILIEGRGPKRDDRKLNAIDKEWPCQSRALTSDG